MFFTLLIAQNQSSFILKQSTLGLLIAITLVGCASNLPQDNNAGQSNSHANFSFERLETGAAQQTAFFEIQSSVVLYELGVDPEGVGRDALEYRQEIINAPDVSTNLPDSLPITDTEFFENQKAIYQRLQPTPEAFKVRLKNLEQQIYEELPQLEQADGIWLGEAVQLVNPGEASQVTDRLIGSYVVEGAFQNGYIGWVAQIIVDFDTWQIVSYHLVNSEMLSQPLSAASAGVASLSIGQQELDARYFRRVASVKVLESQALQGTYSPYASPVALISASGEVTIQR